MVPIGNYWDMGVPNFEPAHVSFRSDYDVIVVGAGYTGLAVALGLANKGASVLVLDANGIGFGASSRNGGMVGPSFHKLGVDGLNRKYGERKSMEIMRAGIDALEYCQKLFSQEFVDADFNMPGRFRGARTSRDLKNMISECKRLNSAVGLEFEVVSLSDVKNHIGTQTYMGGIFYPRDGGLHPKKLLNSFAEKAVSAGVHLFPRNAVVALRKHTKGHEVKTEKANFNARDVVVATNGYSTSAIKLFHERVIPIEVSVAATRELGEEEIGRMSPRFQMHGESGRVFVWSRPTPDRKRFMFGGRLCRTGSPLGVQKKQISSAVSRIFPELSASDFTNVWHGNVAYTYDHTPHLNKIEDLWLIGGFCGSGITRSFYFANKLVRKMSGQTGSETPFDDLSFPKVPFRPFSPLGARCATEIYKWLDRRDSWKQ